MPSPDAILNSAAVIANEWRWLAIGWHAAIVVLLLPALSRRLSQPSMAMLIGLPIASVSTMAWWSGNPFNGTVFMVLALLMLIAATRLEKRTLAVGRPSYAAAGSVLLIFGLVYPHFLAASSWTSYLYASPFGLLPCPTLAGVAGLSLMFGAFGSRRWASGAALALLTYGIIGVAVLGVWIDVMLIAGALVLLRPASALTDHAGRSAETPPATHSAPPGRRSLPA